MQRRRTEVRSFVYKVPGCRPELLEYVHIAIDPCPAPSQENPYCAGGRCRPDAGEREGAGRG